MMMDSTYIFNSSLIYLFICHPLKYIYPCGLQHDQQLRFAAGGKRR